MSSTRVTRDFVIERFYRLAYTRDVLRVLVIVALASCGKSGAPPSPDVDAAPPVARVHVLPTTVFGDRQPGQAVVFIDPDGTIDADTTIDANGFAEAQVSPGASVSVVWTRADISHSYTNVATILGVQPGDEIAFGTDITPTQPTLDVALTALAGAASYDIVTPCNVPYAGMPGVTTLDTHTCQLPPVYDLYAIARDSNGEMIATTRVSGIAAGTASVALPSTWSPFVSSPVSFTNVPADVDQIAMFHSCEPLGATTSIDLLMAPWSGSLSIPQVCSPNAVLGITVLQDTKPTGDFSGQTITRITPDGQLATPIDVGARLLPWMSISLLDATRTILTPQLDTTDANLTPELFIHRLVFHTTDASVSWLLFGPTADPVTLPTLPAHAIPITPQMAGNVSDTGGFMFASSKPQSWDALRPGIVQLFEALYTTGFHDDAAGDVDVWQHLDLESVPI